MAQGPNFVVHIDILVQGTATHCITGATSGGSGGAKYNFISFFLNFMTIKIFFYTKWSPQRLRSRLLPGLVLVDRPVLEASQTIFKLYK